MYYLLYFISHIAYLMYFIIHTGRCAWQCGTRGKYAVCIGSMGCALSMENLFAMFQNHHFLQGCLLAPLLCAIPLHPPYPSPSSCLFAEPRQRLSRKMASIRRGWKEKTTRDPWKIMMKRLCSTLNSRRWPACSLRFSMRTCLAMQTFLDRPATPFTRCDRATGQSSFATNSMK